jgi:hypothetical protein
LLFYTEADVPRIDTEQRYLQRQSPSLPPVAA